MCYSVPTALDTITARANRAAESGAQDDVDELLQAIRVVSFSILIRSSHFCIKMIELFARDLPRLNIFEQTKPPYDGTWFVSRFVPNFGTSKQI